MVKLQFTFSRFVALLALLLLALAFLGIDRLVLTGDEQRYLMYARSILEHGRFGMTLPEWQAFYSKTTGLLAPGLPTGGDGALIMHGIYLPAVLSPVALAFGLPGLRGITLFIGFVGLTYLFRLCKQAGSNAAAWLATSVAALSIPLLPYLHLFYMETFLFTTVVVGWLRQRSSGRNVVADVVTAVLILAIPFVHMRGSVVAAVLYLAFILRLYRRGFTRRAAALMLLAIIAFVALVVSNVAIYGVITGPVISARPTLLPSDLLDTLAMQLFSERHGLLIYAPVWLMGLAGLVVGALRGSSLSRQGLLLASIAAMTGVGPASGECWPARYWVQSVPMLALGLSTFWTMGQHWLLRGMLVAFIAFTLLNTALFFVEPNTFLENRQANITYQHLFDHLGSFNFGLNLPVEANHTDQSDLWAARLLTLAAALFVVFVVAGAIRRPVYAVPALGLMLAALDLSRVSVLPSTNTVVVDRNLLTMQFERPLAAGDIQFGQYWQSWYIEPKYPRFQVTVVDAEGMFGWTAPANQVISFNCSTAARSITIRQDGNLDLAAQVNARLVVYQSRSVLRSWVVHSLGNCR